MNHAIDSANAPPATLPGVDVVRADYVAWQHHFSSAQRVGLLTNHTGQNLQGTSTLAVLRELGIQVRVLFAPEHGPAGTREGDIESGQTADGLPIYSLYGTTRRPTPDMLAELDVVICDIQDVGARFYTYPTTLAYMMEECARYGVAVIVLDRPNPLGGEIIEGPGIAEEWRSFVGHLQVPVRHGMTLGELARLYQSDAGLDLKLTVIPVGNWHRAQQWPETKLPWIAPSPNLPDYVAAAWYPGLCLLEFSGMAVGRGTDAPFQIVGAPWLDPERILAAMASWPALVSNITGEAIEFVPPRALYEGEQCRGVRFQVGNDTGTPQYAVPLGLCLLATLHQTHPAEFNEEKLYAAQRLVGSPPVLEALKANDIDTALRLARDDAQAFAARREPFLIY